MTWSEWNQAMADELNEAGFKAKGFNQELGRWEKNSSPYDAHIDPKYFMLGVVEGAPEVSYLKDIGLLNNGRCPMCGGKIIGSPGRFTSGSDPDLHFQICQKCVNHGRKTSMNPANNTGCLVALLLLPWNLIKSVASHIFG